MNALPERPKDPLSYPIEERPGDAQLVEIVPGINWARMPLGGQLAYINIWLIADGDGWTVVDTGLGNQESTDVWEKLLDGPLGGKPIKRVIVTHMHGDHVGMAGWLVRRFHVELWMTRIDFLMCRNLVADTGREAPSEAIRFYRAAGLSEEGLERYRTRFGLFGRNINSLPNSYRRIREHDEIEIGGRTFQILIGSGHTAEHACLYCPSENLLISGDQILPRISSNVSVQPTEPDANPLQDWIDSCHKLKGELPEDALVLPAHQEPFHGVHLRLQALIDDHETSLERLHAWCAEPRRAVDCFPALYRSRITSGVYLLATGESLAHLNCLMARGRLTRTSDASGVDWYKAA